MVGRIGASGAGEHVDTRGVSSRSLTAPPSRPDGARRAAVLPAVPVATMAPVAVAARVARVAQVSRVAALPLVAALAVFAALALFSPASAGAAPHAEAGRGGSRAATSFATTVTPVATTGRPTAQLPPAQLPPAPGSTRSSGSRRGDGNLAGPWPRKVSATSHPGAPERPSRRAGLAEPRSRRNLGLPASVAAVFIAGVGWGLVRVRRVRPVENRGRPSGHRRTVAR